MHSHAAQQPSVPLPTFESPEERKQRLIALYLNRVDYLFDSFRFWRSVANSRLPFNESLKAGAQSLNPRAKKKPPRQLVDLEIELLINARAVELAKERSSNSGKPDQDDVNAASQDIIAKVRPRRGRPADPHLVFYVQAFMALYRQTCGNRLRAGITRNGEYDPHIKLNIQNTMLNRFRSIDPSVTVATLADIIVKAERSGAVEGKRFGDFFPFYGGSVDTDTGHPIPGPGYRLERFVRVTPIYSS